MRKYILFFFAAIVLLAALLVRCTKEYSYEGGPPAEFTIEGAPSSCSPVSIFGLYITGSLLDSTNYVVVTADVTQAGKYTIVTYLTDGILFSASGIFTDTGSQIVLLKVKGTPAKAGNFKISIAGDNGCSFNLIVNKKAPASYVLSGDTVDCSNPIIQDIYVQNKQLTDKNNVVVTVHVVTNGTYTISTDTIAGISFSASGYFSEIGNQTVTLAGAGTPNEAGRFYFNVHADSSRCSFSVPIGPAFPVAVYVLEYGQDTVCLQYQLSGNYVSAVPLDKTNILSFKVYVTEVGNYSVYTQKINGILFGTSGKFSQLGEQTIVLAGSGTPTIGGNFTVRPEIVGPFPLGGNFCDFTLHVQ